MDIKESTQLTKEKTPLKLADVLESSKKQFIRTMQGDIESLKKGQPTKPSLPKVDQTKKARRPEPAVQAAGGQAPPPTELPVIEPAKRPTPPSFPPFRLKSAEGIRRETEIKKRIEETQKKLEAERMRAEMARQKTEQEKEEGRKKEVEAVKSVPLGKKPSFISRLLRLFRPAVIKPPLLSRPVSPKSPVIPQPIPPKPVVKGIRLKIVFVGIGAIVIIAGIGGFFYWWNYLRVIPPVAMYYECQDFQCVSIEGQGEDQCLNDEDCQPAEPTVPDSLIQVDETRAIELTIGQENLFLDDLKLLAAQTQTLNTFKRILAKLVSQTEKKYFDLDAFVSAFGITLPDSILFTAATSDVEGGNYTLFFYSQPTGNRLAMIIALAEGVDLSQELRNWETSIKTDLKAFFLGLDIEIQPTAAEEFQDNLYRDVAIRYLNFPGPDLSIDYAVVGNKLVITTSRESMYAAIDTLLAANPIGEAVINCGQIGPDNPDPTGIVKNCIEKRFKECKPTQYTVVLDLGSLGGSATYYYEIIGPKDSLCEVKSKFLVNPNPDWLNKEMICKYDNSKDFEIAVQDISNCQGELYDLMTVE